MKNIILKFLLILFLIFTTMCSSSQNFEILLQENDIMDNVNFHYGYIYVHNFKKNELQWKSIRGYAKKYVENNNIHNHYYLIFLGNYDDKISNLRDSSYLKDNFMFYTVAVYEGSQNEVPFFRKFPYEEN